MSKEGKAFIMIHLIKIHLHKFEILKEKEKKIDP